jgi:hypothetical protein
MYEYDAKVSGLIGKTITAIRGMEAGSERIEFDCADGSKWQMMYHDDCCASCSVEDVCGDVADLIGSQVVRAEVPSSLDNFDEEKAAKGDSDYMPESYTWTFVILGTAKGTLTLRWFGSSNGYYSESPTFEARP